MSLMVSLRSLGHEVGLVRDLLPGAPDQHVIDLAESVNSVLITEVKDFGRLAMAGARSAPAVVLVRAPHGGRRGMEATLFEWLPTDAATIAGCIVVVEPGRIRISRRSQTG